MTEPQAIGKLISVIKRGEQIYFREKVGGKGVCYGKVKIFKYLGKHKGATQKEITDFFSLDKSTTSYLINKMIKENDVKKETNKKDRRSQRLYLTANGLKKFRMLKGELFDDWTKQLLRGFSAAEKKKALAFINRMAENAKI